MTEQKAPSWPARVVEVLDDSRVVINRGSRDGLKMGLVCLVYGLGANDLVDPETHENLGRLEVVRGFGKVTHIQEKVATLSSAKTAPQTKRVVKRNPFIFSAQETETIHESPEVLPFDDAAVGDFVRPT